MEGLRNGYRATLAWRSPRLGAGIEIVLTASRVRRLAPPIGIANVSFACAFPSGSYWTLIPGQQAPD